MAKDRSTSASMEAQEKVKEVTEEAVRLFYKSFPSEANVPRSDLVIATAPGRVNLIGDHTDYNDGFVLPLALDKPTVVVGVRSPAGEPSHVVSGDYPHAEFYADIERIAPTPQHTWQNYIRGVAAMYLQHTKLSNMNVRAAIVSRVPAGSGLSSSAALEVSYATFLEAAFNISDVTPTQKALFCQRSEHEYCNTPCGIMDQFISSCGEGQCALLIDCRSYEKQRVTVEDEDTTIVVCNSNVTHTHSGGGYASRVEQCKEAVSALQKKYPGIKALRDASLEQLESIKSDLSDVTYRRARHAIAEDDRVTQTVKLLANKEYAKVGQLMYDSHYSLRDDYEVSTPELDELVRRARSVEGVYGARMSGGGFGGCIVVLLRRAVADELQKKLDAPYPPELGQELPPPASFLTFIGDGAHIIQEGALLNQKQA